ncbi:hypothetical protein COY87_01425 [Candidatus Roizmanbacteria bacterium CG_4_10_14_0_8_um_filter_33_9]|uniref:Large ribosomal subunit protein uL1 n=1 Tax=Candidatus Roizmanbacteria bacterium CG_4_10_14_0_8_um_filter_33_9 TaxID=1974826 RepID=A0A2M7QKI3_9BACT|nr:MAG: hypothetical protein COY87_01425 [Candidatus Roizmanbacteria bacterium CG_4_10_14_0_8_um_filter_33_9]
MGKMKHRALGLEDIEKEQKEKQKKKAFEKKAVVKEIKEEAAKKSKKTEVRKKKKGQSRRGKKYTKAKKSIEKNKAYSIEEAIKTIKSMKYAQFDEAVETHMNVDKTGLKGEMSLPHSIGKTIRVAIVDDALLEKIAAGKIEFDILVTHPQYMPKLARFAKVLGPKGLMPNPKAGTISPNPEEVVKKFSKGVLRWKTEPKFPLIHQMIGKVSFEDKQLVENVQAFIEIVGKVHILEIYLKSTMSPSLKIDIQKV